LHFQSSQDCTWQTYYTGYSWNKILQQKIHVEIGAGIPTMTEQSRSRETVGIVKEGKIDSQNCPQLPKTDLDIATDKIPQQSPQHHGVLPSVITTLGMTTYLGMAKTFPFYATMQRQWANTTVHDQ